MNVETIFLFSPPTLLSSRCLILCSRKRIGSGRENEGHEDALRITNRSLQFRNNCLKNFKYPFRLDSLLMGKDHCQIRRDLVLIARLKHRLQQNTGRSLFDHAVQFDIDMNMTETAWATNGDITRRGHSHDE